jgi:hypothetical protein
MGCKIRGKARVQRLLIFTEFSQALLTKPKQEVHSKNNKFTNISFGYDLCNINCNLPRVILGVKFMINPIPTLLFH